MKTHRCPESLKQRMSIRYTNPYSMCKGYSEDLKWYLYEYYEDWDEDIKGIDVVCSINVCPFCGEILK